MLFTVWEGRTGNIFSRGLKNGPRPKGRFLRQREIYFQYCPKNNKYIIPWLKEPHGDGRIALIASSYLTFRSGSHFVFIQFCSRLLPIHILSVFRLDRFASNSSSQEALAKARSILSKRSWLSLATPFVPLLIHLVHACSRWKSHR